jgi:glycosyltransferase involved in cell wall biosynthesis
MEVQISVIITARNNGKYLQEAIESCLKQTLDPLEIIYCDDYSTDDSVKIASRYAKVKVITHNQHLGVVEARNDGALKSKGNVLVFLDGDDIMPIDFLERHLQVFDESTPFVYCQARAFGLFDILWKVYSWGTLFLWNRNFVNTSAMMWKQDFMDAGMWKETRVKTMWDWSLAVRMARLGKPRKSTATLLYRQHQESWSIKKEKKNAGSDFLPLTESIRRELVIITVGLIYSGRIPGFIDKWIKRLVDDIKFLDELPQLIIINNSDENLSDVSDYEDCFRDIKIIKGHKLEPYQTEAERRNHVCELLADQYNIILENSVGEIIHLREDDIIPDKGSFKQLFDFITSGNPVVEAVSGIYVNRNPKYRRIIGGFYNDNEPRKTQDLEAAVSKEPFKVDFAGTGFLMFWKELCPIFLPYIYGIQAHDWAWSMKLKCMGGSIYIIPGATCKHYTDERNYVEYDGKIKINPLNTYIKPQLLDGKKSVVVKSLRSIH